MSPISSAAISARFDGSTGAFLGSFASGGGLNQAGGLTFGPDGNLYVSSSGTGEVKRYDGMTGTFLDNFVPEVPLFTPGRLFQPIGLAFGPDGNLYVVSQGADQVER